MTELTSHAAASRSPYRVPADYFESLEQRVMARIEPCGAQHSPQPAVATVSAPRRVAITLRRVWSAVGVAAAVALFAMITHAYIFLSSDDAAVVFDTALMGQEYAEDGGDYTYDFLGFDSDEIYDYVTED